MPYAEWNLGLAQAKEDTEALSVDVNEATDEQLAALDRALEEAPESRVGGVAGWVNGDATPECCDEPMRFVAQLVKGGFGARIYHLSMSGFDTHARQGTVHSGLLERLSSALTAFQRDLQARGVDDEVATFVFSEFGRRVRQNASGGTDHGRGAPVLLLGGRIRGGLHGQRPDLDDLVEGDVPATTDFRTVYRTLDPGHRTPDVVEQFRRMAQLERA